MLFTCKLITCNQRHNSEFVSQEKVRVLQTYSRRKTLHVYMCDTLLIYFNFRLFLLESHIKQFAADFSLFDTDIHGYI